MLNKAWPEFNRVLLLTAVVALSFFPCLFHPFVYWDDDAHVFDNALVISRDWAAIPAIFQTVVNKTYIPLSILSFNLEHRLFGLNPFFFHLDNILLHILVCLAIYRLIGRMGFGKNTALLTAVLFGVHPMHVESVAWVTARKDVLYSLFYVLAMDRYWIFLSGGKKRSYVLSLAFAFLSILAKPMALSLPLVLGLLDWYKNKKLTFKSCIPIIPFAAIVAAVAWMTFVLNRTPMANPPLEAALIWIWSLAFYLNKFFFPAELVPLYVTPQPVSLLNPSYALAVMTTAVFAGAVFYFRKNRVVLMASLYFLLSIFFLLRVSDVTKNLGPSVVADRFMYLPSLGFCLLLADALLKKPKLKWLTVVLVALMIAKSSAQCRVWQDDLTLWNYVINHRQESFLAYNSRAVALVKHKEKKAAMADFNKALALNPGYARGHYNRGKLYADFGNQSQALEDFDKAIALYPRDNNYYVERGVIHSKRQEFAQAIADFNAALELKPGDAGAYNNRGIAHKKTGNYQAALDDYTRAIGLNPDSAQAYINRANIWEELHRNDEALKDLRQAQALGFRVDLKRIERLMTEKPKYF
jgi:tetratricopeptide (TPR) repeat protein